jgi:regulator of sigma E protease
MATFFTFVLFLSPLIFFHELGHYLAAKFVGVKVEKFSIGFGPVLFSKKLFNTEWIFSIIPFGGFVKLYGDSEEDVEKTLSAESYLSKKPLQKICIVIAGPLLNFVLAVLIYIFLGLKGELITPVIVGSGYSSSQSLFMPGDALLKINNKPLYGLEDFSSPEEIVKDIVIDRNGKELTLLYNKSVNALMLDLMVRVPLTNYQFIYDGHYYSLNCNGRQINLFNELNLDDKSTCSLKTLNFNVEANGINKIEILDLLASKGVFPAELVIEEIQEKFPVFNTGLSKRDAIYSINNVRIYSFGELKSFLESNKEKPVSLSYYSYEIKKISTISNIYPQKVINAENVSYVLGIKTQLSFAETKTVVVKNELSIGLFDDAVERLMRNTTRIMQGFLYIIHSKNPISMIGGPVTIAKAASSSLDLGADYFFRLMALISINLGVVNLLPIPVLDGGHLVFLLIEFVFRKPVPRKYRELFTKLGMILLFTILALSLFSDIRRFF